VWHIDLISLDIEGGELTFLRTFPWNLPGSKIQVRDSSTCSALPSLPLSRLVTLWARNTPPLLLPAKLTIFCKLMHNTKKGISVGIIVVEISVHADDIVREIEALSQQELVKIHMQVIVLNMIHYPSNIVSPVIGCCQP
jgi:hypothetical protein